ncbi:T6SS immunity protein Tdi1 domain-containing protein [Nocardioides okcheonensis]|uniref:T6SS immunity protein Tdi1 domain-containing protein n=1 Tax=Nocardioides okcheonensis TaxID=2894081 RepID=UPI001E4D2359|nr:T6SS immunity protein Tdi1 domain-containing protein [Nocardioides okcheonensis]UFN43195.1 DUF1851 domain-containing protein [Nocardioides okcheonensis]
MFERLLTSIPQSRVSGPADSGTPPAGVRAALGHVAGATLGRGLYRLHTAHSAAAADRLVADAYPDFEGRIACFGMDWLGRQFSLDPTRGRPDDPEVLLFDVGAGEALEIPTAFSQFHDSELTEYADAALAATFFDQWLEAHPAAIRFDQCVGYNVPLFLGGVDGVENLDVTDLDVYWTLTGQLRVAALGHS